MLPRLFKGIYHFSVYAIGILVLSAAVLVTLIRLVLPDIGIYRGEVEAWVSNYMGYPVVIHSLDASWVGWVPHLYLHDIDLLNRAGTQEITHFDSAQIRIAPLDTLLKRRIVPKQLVINGFELAITRKENGAIYIEGINVSETQADRLSNNELAEWLFRQEQIRIEKGTIEWIDVKHQQAPILLSDVSLILRSDGTRLQAEGSTRLPAAYGKKMDFAFDATGDLLSSDWSGELYLSGGNINPENWYKTYRPLNFNISGGSADIKVWSIWQQAQLKTLSGELEYNDFNTSSDNAALNIEKLAYSFQGERIANDGWQFELNLDNFRTDNGDWPESNITVTAVRDNSSKAFRYSAAFDYLKLDDLSPFMGSLTFLPDPVKENIKNISINGNLKQGKIIYDPDKEMQRRFRFDTRFEGLDTALGANLPLLTNLSGRLHGYINEGVVTLESGNTRVETELLEKGVLQLESIAGSLSWLKSEEEWQLFSDQVILRTEELSLEVNGEISRHKDINTPFLDVLVKVHESDLETIAQHLPRTKNFKLRDWMQRSVLAGRLSSARALFRGYLSDFPFDDHKGRFLLLADATDATLDYSQLYPPVDNIDAEIMIDGRSLLSHFSHGTIFSATITEGTFGLANILQKKKTVSLSGNIRGTTKDLSLFVEQSPLHKDPNLKEISASLKGGDFDMELNLLIPVKQPDKKPDITGSIKLVDSTLSAPVEGLRLDNVTGNLSFTESSVTTEDLNASFFELPVALSLSGSKNDPDNKPAIRITGRADNQFVADRLVDRFPALQKFEHYLRNRISGEAEWSVTLTSNKDESTKKIVKFIEVESYLSGLEIDFPAPIGKKNYQRRAFRVLSRLGTEVGNKKTIIDYDSIFKSELVFNTDKKLNTINMHFGSDPIPENDKRGLFITGAVDQLSPVDWWEIIKERDTSSDPSNESLIDSGIKIDLNVATLELLNQDFNSTAVTITRPEKNWNFALNGESIAGDILIPGDRTENNQISFDLVTLKLKPGTSSSESSADPLQPQLIPSIVGKVENFAFDDFDLGVMNLQTMPLQNGLLVESITFNKAGLNIDGKGEWINQSSGDTSEFDITLHADEMETMLTTFSYDQSPVKKGETELQLIADWDGSPMEFALEKMHGTLDMKISKGQMLDVNPSAGRLFGLFSLQTLSRRLTLDFSDIFGKGLAFDRIEGSFDIDNGNAYTNDLYMLGPSANVSISGRTGLAEQDYDQIVTVTPQLSDNLPVAGVLLGPVGIGLGAVFYLAGQMFASVHNSIDNLLRYQYTITGSWNQPVIEKIKSRENPSS